MAEIILTNILNRKISIDELFRWLTSDNLEETICPDIRQNGSTRADFVSYFLSYLREQSKSILPDSKEAQEKSAKKAPNVAQKTAAVGDRENAVRNLQGSPHRGPPLQRVKEAAFGHNNYKSFHDDQVQFSGQIPGPNPGQFPGQFPGQMAGQFPGQMSGQFSGQVAGQFSGQHPGQMSRQYPGQYSGQMSGQFAGQMPINYLQSVRAGPKSPRSADPANLRNSPVPGGGNYGTPQNSLSPYSPGGPHYPFNQMGDASSPYNSPNESHGGGFGPAINQAQMQIGSLNLSGAFDSSVASNASVEMGSPRRFDVSARNGSSVGNARFSPLSPLYANNVSTLSPRRVDRSHNETANSQDYSVSSANASRSSTPKAAPSGGQKTAKAAQNQSFCLGDFVTVEGGGQGARKISRKLLRTQQWRKTQAETNSPVDREKSSASGAKSKRRINPTRLDVSGGKENPGKEVFGVISRPKAANPKFVEAPSTDKSQEEVSFEAERSLLKLERQRRPKSESTPEAASRAEQTEQKLPTKTKPESTVVPCVDLVENVEALNTLANLYSGILDRNLMANPMTELYFLVTLLTTQYKTLSGKKPAKKTASADKPTASGQLLERLKNDLGCAELNDETPTEIDGENSTSPDGESRKHSADEETKESPGPAKAKRTPKKRSDKRKTCSDDYLDTAHNCVYFATMVMLNQQFLLSTLDRATLKLLCENNQINAFQPELQKYLSEIYKDKCLQTKSFKQMDSRSLQTNVCFQVDTDNRETFPTATAFALFRKQRDLFYDILRTWEDRHLQPDWSFQRALKHKINTLLTLHTDAVNYCHFAKLFVSQLLVSSIQSGETEDPMNDESLSFLKSLKHVNPEKLIQLKGRLTTPLSSTGPVPEPIFPGVQEFYRDFILSVVDCRFCVILETSFIHEIMELNETQFAGSEIEGTETTVDETTKQNFITCVSSLRLLAKFTSFTLSLAFETAANSPEWIVSQIQLRGRVLPSLDLRGCLLGALQKGRLSLTVPWVVQYMAMLDTVSLRLPYYTNIGEQLYCIYRISSQLHSTNSMSSQAATLTMFTIGWLFELPNFPRDLYAYWQMNYDGRKLRLLGGADDHRVKGQNARAINAKSSKEFVKPNSSLDKLDIVDDRALYECCPFLAEFKILLTSGNAVLGNTNANRHITPVSSQLSQPTFGAKSKNLQMQLEEAFFHGQPSSIRKTVDFVSERVASGCVKYICNSVITSTKQRHMENFIKSKTIDVAAAIKYYPKEDREEEDKETEKENEREEEMEKPPEQRPGKKLSKAQKSRSELMKQMDSLATTIKEAVKRECKEKISSMCEERTVKSIESLLAEDALPSVKKTCTAIAKRMAMQRVDEWIELHVTKTLFLKNMTFELRKMLKEGDVDQAGKENRHNPEAPCPTEAIEMLRNSMWELLEKKGRWMTLSAEAVKKTLTCLRRTLTERADLVDYPERNLYGMSVEFCLLLLSNRQDLFSMEIQQEFTNIWRMNNASRVGEGEGLFARIISPRNIRLLTHSSDKTVLRGFGRLLKGLLKEDLLSLEALSDQCVALFRQEWPEEILKQLSQCLNEVVSDYKSSSAHAECVKNLLVWIAATCEEMDMCDYD